MEDRRQNERTPMVKVSDDQNGPNGVPTKWMYDPDVKKYKRYQGEIFLSSIRGGQLPDPDLLEQSRRYITVSDIEALVRAAEKRNKDPVQFLIDNAKPRPVQKATRDMWNHWKGVK